MTKRRGVWFPLPQEVSDLELLGPTAELGRDELFRLLTHPSAVELREKVGVMSPADGSAKVTSRLLRTDRWFFKTDEHHRAEDPTVLRGKLRRALEPDPAIRIWNPRKSWFLLRVDRYWWPISACPVLRTLRQLTDWEDKVNGWSQMLEQGLELTHRHQIGLDLNPSNFGHEPKSGQLYYLDDELYPPHGFQDFAAAVVARIPEEPRQLPQAWEEWGSRLQQSFATYCRDNDDWAQFLTGMLDYPLTRAFEESRQALIRGLSKKRPRLDASTRRQTKSSELSSPGPVVVAERRQQEPRLTCVFADVHGNRPALEAVLRACHELKVDSYLFLGDVVGYGPDPGWCIQRLAELPNAILLRGNHDDMVASGEIDESTNRYARAAINWTLQQLDARQRQWLGKLLIEHKTPTWLAVHGSPCCPQRFQGYVYELTYRDNLLEMSQKGYQVCFYGHSHVQFVYQRTSQETYEKVVPSSIKVFNPEHQVLINPGSVGQPRDGDPRAAFAIWDRRRNWVSFHRVDYSVESMVRAIHEAGLPEDLARRLEIGR